MTYRAILPIFDRIDSDPDWLPTRKECIVQTIDRVLAERANGRPIDTSKREQMIREMLYLSYLTYMTVRLEVPTTEDAVWLKLRFDNVTIETVNPAAISDDKEISNDYAI